MTALTTPTRPTLTVRRALDRGRADFGWLDSRHSFSFGQYYDPRHMGFRSLRVINEDRVAGGGGFPTHPHRDMEILSYVIDGALEHKDSLGTGSVIKTGDWQRMTAGTGVRHSEFNASKAEPVHFLQIWIVPDAEGLKPGYDQKFFARAEKVGQLKLVASQDGANGSLRIEQDAKLFNTVLPAGGAVTHTLAAGRGAWVQVVSGALTVNGVALSAGDGASLDLAPDATGALTFAAAAGQPETEFLLFDLK
jgi:quercetin 2,3-dioxygenase